MDGPALDTGMLDNKRVYNGRAFIAPGVLKEIHFCQSSGRRHMMMT